MHIKYFINPHAAHMYTNGSLVKDEENGGYDLKAFFGQEHTLHMLDRILVPTGIFLAPEMRKVHCDIRPTSGLPHKHGVMPVLGLIDWGYRNELKVNLINLSRDPFTLKPGDKIGQIVFWQELPFELVAAKTTAELGETKRGELGFGGQSGVV
jgi:dUTP pyrophosphatase